MRLPRHHVIVVEINKAPVRFLVQQGFMRHQQEGERLPFIRIRGMNVIKLGIGHKAPGGGVKSRPPEDQSPE